LLIEGLFLGGKSAGDVKLTTPLFTQPKIGMNGAIPPFSTCFHARCYLR